MYILILGCKKYLEISVGIFMLRRCWIFCLEVSVRAVPKNTKKAKKAWSATFFVLDFVYRHFLC